MSGGRNGLCVTVAAGAGIRFHALCGTGGLGGYRPDITVPVAGAAGGTAAAVAGPMGVQSQVRDNRIIKIKLRAAGRFGVPAVKVIAAAGRILRLLNSLASIDLHSLVSTLAAIVILEGNSELTFRLNTAQDLFAETIQDHCGLCAGGAALWRKGSVTGAVHQAGMIGPLHGDTGIAADAGCVRIAGQVGGSAHIILLIRGVAVQNGRHLLPGDGVVGAEPAVPIAAYNAVC